MELLCVLCLVALLMGLGVHIAVTVLRQASDAACRSNLRQVWAAVNVYANAHDGHLFVNLETPLRVSNVIYKSCLSTGLGLLHPAYLKDYHVLFCPADPGRGPAWEYGWSNWGVERGEVQCSYGYRSGQGILSGATWPLTLSQLDRSPRKVVVSDYYETFFAPPRVHHSGHTNVLRFSGAVDPVERIVSFGPAPEDFQHALDVLDR